MVSGPPSGSKTCYCMVWYMYGSGLLGSGLYSRLGSVSLRMMISSDDGLWAWGFNDNH